MTLTLDWKELKMSATEKMPWAGHLTPRHWPVPDGVEPFQRGETMNGGIEVDCYLYGGVLVALAHADILRIEFLSVKLGSVELETNLLGFGATGDYTWTSVYLDPDLLIGHSLSDLTFEFLTIGDDDE